MCYLKTTLSYRQYGWVGDSKESLRLHLYADADLASDPEDSVSTSGAYFAVVGPNTHVPLGHQCKKQTAVSRSTPEAEIVAADHALRTIGVPALDLWELLLGKPGSVSMDMFEDNDACIRIFQTGKNPNMRHIGRTHRIAVAWMHERLSGPDVRMFRADSELMAADIFTKPFPECKRAAFEADLLLINIRDSADQGPWNFQPSVVKSQRGVLADVVSGSTANDESNVDAYTCPAVEPITETVMAAVCKRDDAARRDDDDDDDDDDAARQLMCG